MWCRYMVGLDYWAQGVWCRITDRYALRLMIYILHYPYSNKGYTITPIV